MTIIDFIDNLQYFLILFSGIQKVLNILRKRNPKQNKKRKFKGKKFQKPKLNSNWNIIINLIVIRK